MFQRKAEHSHRESFLAPNSSHDNQSHMCYHSFAFRFTSDLDVGSHVPCSFVPLKKHANDGKWSVLRRSCLVISSLSIVNLDSKVFRLYDLGLFLASICHLPRPLIPRMPVMLNSWHHRDAKYFLDYSACGI